MAETEDFLVRELHPGNIPSLSPDEVSKNYLPLYMCVCVCVCVCVCDEVSKNYLPLCVCVCVCVCVQSCPTLSVTPWTVTHQAPQSTGFPGQEYWSGLSLPPPEDLPS